MTVETQAVALTAPSSSHPISFFHRICLHQRVPLPNAHPGDEFPEIVAERMWRCRAAIIILSADYVASQYCRNIEGAR